VPKLSCFVDFSIEKIHVRTRHLPEVNTFVYAVDKDGTLETWT